MRITMLPVYSKLADPAEVAKEPPLHQLDTYRALTNPDIDVVINTAVA